MCALLFACGDGAARRAESLDRDATGEQSAAICTPVWNPTWRQASGANNWWVEYTITGGTVTAASLQVGSRQVQLTLQWGKWVGPAGAFIATGTPVIVHARNSLNQEAQTFSFGYLATTQPMTDPCAGVCVPSCSAAIVCGDDGCGGSCGTCPAGQTCSAGACVAGCVAPWDPLWQQASGANSWWVEYAITGNVSSAFLQVGSRQVALTLQWGKWVGPAGAFIATGTQVVLHATDTAGRTAQTFPFGYLSTTRPLTDPCQGSGPPNPCTPLTAGMVSIAFDDGRDSQYTLARAPLLAHGTKATMYLVTDYIQGQYNGYLSLAQARTLATDGNEIGSHSLSHPDLRQLSEAQIDDQLRLSKLWLETNLGVTVTDFALPFGYYNDTVTGVARRYYQSQATTVPGLNFRGDDLYQLRRDFVISTTTLAEVQAWIREAQSAHGWRILAFHYFTTGAPGDVYGYRIGDFAAVLDAISASGIEVVTVSEGVARLRCP